MSRPTSQHRLSVGAASSLPNRNSYSRSHSHTISLGSANNAANRVSRRKSSNFSPATNVAALGAAVENGVADGSIAVNRRSSTSKNGHASLQEGGQPASLPQGVPVPERTPGGGSALVDGPPLSSYNDKSKPKMRRASDGTRLTKKERANTGELKCEHCGKAYKHGSCLNKHLSVSTAIVMCDVVGMLTLIADGSILRNGNTHPNCSSPSTSRCSSLKRHLFWYR